MPNTSYPLTVLVAVTLAAGIDGAAALSPNLILEQCSTTTSGLGVCVIKPPSRPSVVERFRELFNLNWFDRPSVPMTQPDGPAVD